MLNTGATPKQFNEVIRRSTYFCLSHSPPHFPSPHSPPPPLHAGLYELHIDKPCKSPADLPSWAWWQERRSIGGGQTEAWLWARVAIAEDLVQCGFDETQINGKPPQQLKSGLCSNGLQPNPLAQ